MSDNSSWIDERPLREEDAAAAKIKDIKSGIAAVTDSFDPGPFKTALPLLPVGNELTGFAGQCLSDEELELLGLENVLTEDEIYVKLTAERLIDLDPDILIFPPETISENQKSVEQTIAALKALPGVGDMKAIKANNFVIIGDDLDRAHS